MKEKIIYLAEMKGYVPTFLDGKGIVLQSIYVGDYENIRYLEWCLIQKWLMVSRNVFVEIDLNFTPTKPDEFGYGVSIMTHINDLPNLKWLAADYTGVWVKTYEAALSIGLKYVLIHKEL